MVITISQAEKGSKPFRLYNTGLEDPDFQELAGTGFSKPIRGIQLIKLQKKLKSLSKQWAVEMGNSTKQVALARTELQALGNVFKENPTSILLHTHTLQKKGKTSKM